MHGVHLQCGGPGLLPRMPMGGSTGPNSVRVEAVGPPFRFALYKRTSDQVATPVDPRARHRVNAGRSWLASW